MSRAMLANASTPVKIIFSVLVILFAWFIFQFIALLTGMFIFSIPFEDAANILKNIQHPEGINFLKYVQAISSIGLFIFSSLTIAYFFDIHILKFLYLEKNPGFKNLLLIFILILVILPFSNLMTELNENLQLPDSLQRVQHFLETKEEEMNDIVKRFLDARGVWVFLLNILVIALIPAIGEELLFRGVFQKLFISLFKNVHLGIIITAFIFSALHLQFLSFLPRFILGIIFGYFVVWSESLWPAIIAHFINNALAVIYYYFFYAGKIGDEMEMIGSPGHGLYYGLLSMVISGAIIFLIFRNYRDNNISSDSIHSDSSY